MAISMASWLFVVLVLAHGVVADGCPPVVITETVYVMATQVESTSVDTPVVPPPPPHPTSSIAYTVSAPPANGFTFTSAQKPQNTGDPSLLCPQVAAQAAAGAAIPPMPFGAHLDAAIATYDALPTLAAALCQAPDHFHKVTATANHGSIKNSCDYEVYVDSVGCGGGAQHELIPAGHTWTEPLRSCADSGSVYKVTKADNPTKPIQFEFNAKDDLVHYDISFLDCMRPNTTDLSACPGWEGGIQCVPGKQGCQLYVCGPGEYCDGSSYTVPEFGVITGVDGNEDWRKLAGAPNTACDTKREGLVFELCATN